MKYKDIRAAQLEELKGADNVNPLTYHVELLNGSFFPRQRWEFETLEEARKKAEELEQWNRPAFIRKYAAIRF